jgi:hypothetical protein
VETLTFYSYKGGTGRSLLVANSARYVAALGKRVVAIDFDLEAPGLHYKLPTGRTAGRTGEVPPERGVVDYLLAASTDRTDSVPLSRYLLRVPVPRSTTGELYLMPAGSAPSGDYWRTLSSLTRGDFFTDPEGSGIAACLDLKARIENEIEADLLLIDSRTGITEMAGLATTLLADKVVCLMIDNPESLAGTRAVMRSFGQAPRLGGQGPIGLLPVLSRASRDDVETRQRVLRYLNESGPDEVEGLALERIYVLRTDPVLAEAERLLLGGDGAPARTPLYHDYLELLRVLVAADPALLASAEHRQAALGRIKEWLTEPRESRHNLEPFEAEQIEEGVELGNNKKRYADLAVYGGKDRTDALMAIEYVEDLEGSEAWRWWEDNSNLRCVVLTGKYRTRRIFTRSRRARKFQERDETAGWLVRWPASFTALDDPGDRSVESMLRAVQRREDGFIGLLITEWENASFATLRDGGPYRPHLARQILDGLARIDDPGTEMRILRRTAPDLFERRGSLQDLIVRELHAPLWWRLSVRSKIEYRTASRRHPEAGSGSGSAGLDLLARDVLGLVLDQDREFRRDAPRLTGAGGETSEAEIPIYRLGGLFRERELKFEASDAPPPELVRRAVLDRLLTGDNRYRGNNDWSHAEDAVAAAMRDPAGLTRLLQGSGRQWPLIIMNLLCSYDPASCRVTVYRSLVERAASQLTVGQRALANVAFLHATVYAIMHLGSDLDGRMWNEFGVPSARDVNYKPSVLLETLARTFSFKFLERLGDAEMTTAFERLGDQQPPEYQGWRRLRSEPIEQVRRILMRARAGLDSVLPADPA